MDQPFMRAYSQLLIKTCHRRGAHAMGGMAAQIPIKNDEARNARALAKVREDKAREAKDGHDGTWVAHPGLVEIAREQFEAVGPAAERLAVMRDDVSVDADDLLSVPSGSISEAGLRQNLRVGVLYLESWLEGKGCVPIADLMEDAATAEISRTQLWQWIRHRARLDDGRLIDERLFRRMMAEETDEIRRTVGEDRYEDGRFELASSLFERLILRDDLPEFLTIAAYDHI